MQLTDLAYVFFTSGSTGKPKGVAVTHRGLLNCLLTQIDVFRLTSTCHSLFVLSTNFDASVSDIGTTLLAGATLHLEPDELRPSAEFAELLCRRGITHVDLPPSYLTMLDPKVMPECLQTIIIGGEVCAPEVVRRWSKFVRLVNVYGPTEATICSSLGVCDETWDAPLLGQPVPGIEYEVVDERLKPVADDTPGELLIFGGGLARGYVSQPELTETKFPIVRGQRAYLTGDRVVRRTDGEYVFLGRLDRQLKLNGKLIAPEEIEARLAEHPKIIDVAVVGHANDTGMSLVGFVVATTNPTTEEIREYLVERLPRWMCPHRVEIVESLPRTTTGKVDYAKLLETGLFSVEKSAMPWLSASINLRDLWRRVLGRADFNLDDGFYDLGGDSMRALQVVAGAESLGLPISVDMFSSNVSLRQLLVLMNGECIVGRASCKTLRKEARLDATWETLLDSAQSRPPVDTPMCKFLMTGATGFLGSRLLRELLSDTSVSAVCLVRANDTEHARKRLGTVDTTRVNVVCGDIARPRFGLDETTWTSLVNEVDTVIHCAASVNMVASYETLRPANVIGTREVVRFLCEGRRKRLHYASTLSVFVASDSNGGLLRETDELTSMSEMYGGYGQSKWAAEYLLRTHERASGPVSYYRLGLLTGDSLTGQGGSADHLGMVCRGLAKLGCVPDRDLTRWRVDVTPIDYASKAMAYLTKHGPATTYHIANPTSLSLEQLVSGMADFGIDLERVPLDTWRERMRDPTVAVAVLGLCRCLDSSSHLRHRCVDLFQATGVEFETTRTRAALAGSSIACPPPSPDLLARYLRCWFAS